MPKVSIIVPVYNAKVYLQECIESVLNQSFSDLEIILVDDGSKDESYKICEEYQKKDSRIVLLHQENRGVSAARNLGLKNAKGEYIAFCDSDDYVLSNWIEELFCGISIGTDLSCCAYFRVPTDSKHLCKIKKGTYSKSDFWMLLKEGLLNSVYTKMFKRSIIETNALLFDETINNGEDLLFVLSYIKSMKLGFFFNPNQNYSYRVTPNSLTNRYVKNYYINTVNRYEQLKEIYIECGGKWERIEKEYSILCQNAVFFALKNNLLNRNKPLPERLLENKTVINSDFCMTAFCGEKKLILPYVHYKSFKLFVFQLRVLVYELFQKN